MMAEFQEVMKQFDRMCWYYQRRRKCPTDCPMDGVNISQCRKVAFEKPEYAEKTVMAWAKENPEPRYPTWIEWLTDLGVFPHKLNLDQIDILMDTGLLYRIPDEIAEKYRIEQKEST